MTKQGCYFCDLHGPACPRHGVTDLKRLHDENERLREAIREHRDDPLAWEEQGRVDAAAHRDLANETLWAHVETERSKR